MARPWSRLRWLILAPHPDDEVLGAGALIAQTAKAGRFAGVVFLTDGSGSHPLPARLLVPLRKREARDALCRLAGRHVGHPVHLGWKDAAPATPDDRAFHAALRSLAALCQRSRVDAIAVTASHEPHCDHAAAAELAYAVRNRARRAIIVAEYLVWGDAPLPKTHRSLRTAPMPPGQRRHALMAHRSQITASHGPGFRLARERLKMPARDTLYIRRRP